MADWRRAEFFLANTLVLFFLERAEAPRRERAARRFLDLWEGAIGGMLAEPDQAVNQARPMLAGSYFDRSGLATGRVDRLRTTHLPVCKIFC